VIRLDHLSKQFGGFRALDDVTIEVSAGEIFGLLGHNGAGKSTAFGLLLGQFRPTNGEAFIRGISVQRDRRLALHRVGAIYETPGFFEYLTGLKNLQIFASFSGEVSLDEIGKVVRFVGLEKRIGDRVSTYSHGMKRRLGLAQALLPRPDIVVLDEPAEGLDPEGIHEMRRLILRLNRDHGMTVMLSSHLLSEVEQLCDRVGILCEGRLVFNGRWSEAGTDRQRFRIRLDDWAKGLAVFEMCGAAVIEPGLVELRGRADIADLVEELVRGGSKIRAVEPVRQTLEELYLGTVSAR
jgi:ABC-2 type transport system ATP-binding protein